MSKYIVDEEFLKGCKELIELYAQHDMHCTVHMTESCDCGLHARILKLRTIEQGDPPRMFKEVKEKPS